MVHQVRTHDASVNCKTIKTARAACRDETRLRAIATEMRRIPGRVVAAAAIRMTQHRLVIRAVRRPIVARAVDAGGERASLGVRAGQHVVLVRHVAEAFDDFTVLGQNVAFLYVISITLQVTMQVRNTRSDHRALCVVPRARSNATACIYARLNVCRLGAKIGMPRATVGACRLRERLSNLIRASESAEISSAWSPAHNKECHWVLWGLSLS